MHPYEHAIQVMLLPQHRDNIQCHRDERDIKTFLLYIYINLYDDSNKQKKKLYFYTLKMLKILYASARARMSECESESEWKRQWTNKWVRLNVERMGDKI